MVADDGQVGPFHVAANPRDTPEALARRYRAVFGDRARRMADEDEDTGIELGLPVRARLCDAAADILRREDKAAGRDDEDDY